MKQIDLGLVPHITVDQWLASRNSATPARCIEGGPYNRRVIRCSQRGLTHMQFTTSRRPGAACAWSA